jgi:hypothetical protein
VDGPTYIPAVSGGPLRQGEVLSSVEQYDVQVSSEGDEGPVSARRRMHPFSVVLTQDCDLAQDFKGRTSGSPSDTRLLIPNILMCEVDLAENLKVDRDRIALGSDIWKRVVQNQDCRFQYLREITAEFDALGEGIKALLIDFKHTFSLQTEMLYEQLHRAARRRAVLMSPYREQLSFRHAHFISRVALPRDHHA